MASNVFGNPITDETLKGIPKYQNQSSFEPKDRADVAMLWKNAQSKDVNARTYVENLKAAYGCGISALCLIYNATGDTLRFIAKHDWTGSVASSPYPTVIANGQWGAFLHVHPTAQAYGSTGAVVYRGKVRKNVEDVNHDWMVSWSIPYVGSYNKVFCWSRDVGEDGEEKYDSNASIWQQIANLLDRGDFLCTDEEGEVGYSTATIAANTSPVMEAIFTVKGVI